MLIAFDIVSLTTSFKADQHLELLYTNIPCHALVQISTHILHSRIKPLCSYYSFTFYTSLALLCLKTVSSLDHVWQEANKLQYSIWGSIGSCPI